MKKLIVNKEVTLLNIDDIIRDNNKKLPMYWGKKGFNLLKQYLNYSLNDIGLRVPPKEKKLRAFGIDHYEKTN